MKQPEKMRLPYMNNASIILITLGINLALMVALNWGKSFGLADVLLDAAICGVMTAVINVFFVRRYVTWALANKTLPANLPVSRMMMRLPRNPFLLALLCALFFGLLTPLINGMIFIFYDFETLRFGQMLVCKLVYVCFLSAKILEVAIYRYVQPDVTGLNPAADVPPSPLVKPPLPQISYFQQLYNSWLTDFGMNMVLGLVLGGTIITSDDYVMIAPTLRAGILIGGIISGIIITMMTVPALAKKLRSAVASGEIPRLPQRQPGVAWLPQNHWLLALTLCLPIILITVTVYTAVLSFFYFESLNFFQFFFIRTAYTAVLVKALVPLLLIRYMQPQK
jgi:hypothetical protein